MSMRLAIRAAALAVFAATATTAALTQQLDIPEGGYVVSNDVSLLPEAVQKKRLELIAIADAGDIELLAPILDTDRTVVSFGEPDDRIAYLKQNSADREGAQILATLADILEAPYAALDGGDGDPIYLWPYLAAFDGLGDLTPAQRVDAYQLVSHEALEEMVQLEAWYWWRVSMGPEGNLQAFVAGD
jgi:sulfur carrier protein ThiS